MAPRPPNYSQDRLQRERAQAAKAREKARQIVCASNLRQLSLAVGMYVEDNDEVLPNV